MTETSPVVRWSSEAMQRRLRRRHTAERRFQLLGLAAIGVALFALVTLLGSIFANGWSAFVRTRIALEVYFDPAVVGPVVEASPAERSARASEADWAALVREALSRQFPDVSGHRELRELMGLVSVGARSELRGRLLDDPALVGRTETVWVPAASDVDAVAKGQVPRDAEADGARLSAQQLAWVAALEERGRLGQSFDWSFLTSGDSREAELAGVGGAIAGSLLTQIAGGQEAPIEAL